MVETIKLILGAVAAGISIFGYVPYVRDILRGTTKPHAISWLVWGVLNGIAFAGQLQGDGGPGIWAVGLTAIAMTVIFILALKQGEKMIKPFDWLCLTGAGIALILWGLTDGPLASVVLITIIDALGFLPTVRKAYRKPNQETLLTYQINTLKYVLVVAALQRYSLTTTLFPAAVAIMNGLFVALLVIRRRHVGAVSQTT